MIHEPFVYAAIIWAIGLLGWTALLLLRFRDPAARIAVLDMLALILVALLVLLALLRGVPYYLDAAIGLALLSFAATLGFSRFHARGRLF